MSEGAVFTKRFDFFRFYTKQILWVSSIVKLTIYRKMILGFGAVIVIMIVTSTFILFELNTVSNEAKATLTSDVQVVDLAKHLDDILQDENGYAQKYLISRDETYFSIFVASSRRFDQYLNLLLKAQLDEIERSLIRNMRQAHESFVASMHSERDTQDFTYNPVRDNLRSESLKTIYKSLDHLISANQVSIGNAMFRMETSTNRSTKIALLLITGSLLTAILAALMITRTITSPIDDLIRGTEQIARGNFEPVKVSSNDEMALLADALNNMSVKIKNMNKYRTHMIQQISHELQTPLQVMLSTHDMLKSQTSGPLNHEQMQMLDTIRGGIKKLASFSKQYLDLAKIDSGMMKYYMEWTDILQLIEPIVKDAKLIAARKNISIELVTLPLPKVMVDAKKISIIVNNLLGNAIKYTGNHGKVSVKTGSCTMGVFIEIQDSGIGITPEELPKIFTKFYRASNTGRTNIGGIGVGLALVKAFTEGHGGKVYAQSTVDGGSTFTVELPVSPEEFQGPVITESNPP
jgi:two-component system, NtrC family, sensor histidine kinase GlrK